MTARWYIIHAYSGFENKVRDAIRAEAERLGLSALVPQVEVPTEKVTEVRRNKKVVTDRTSFPGYVLAKMDMTDDVYHLVRNTPKVTGFLGPKGKPQAISEAEAARILHMQTAEAAPKAKARAEFEIGDSVRVLSMNLNGTVSTLPNAKGDLYVQMGILRSQVNISDLVLIQEAAPAPSNNRRTGSSKLKMSKSLTVSPELMLLGKTVDEALAELDKYLDDAYLSHLPNVRIVHGKGTGALRNAVHQYLRKVKYVDSFRLGEFGEGDAGVTIALFKK